MNWAQVNRSWRLEAQEAWAPKTPEPLRLRAWLSAPVAWGGWDPITIEGALQSVVVARMTGRMPDDVFRGCPVELPLEDRDIQVPIEDTLEYGPVPIAKASVGVVGKGNLDVVRWYRSRPRAEHYRSAKIRVGMGETKAMNLPAAAVATPTIDFYVVGDRDRLASLLPDVTHLGSKRAGGMGLVTSWEVTSHEDHSLLGPSGELMRTLPASPQYTGCHMRDATVRAPYWLQATRCYACVPTQSRTQGWSSCV